MFCYTFWFVYIMLCFWLFT